MGFSLAWLAVRGKDPAAVRDELGLESTGEYREIPEVPVVGVLLPSNYKR